MLKHIEPGKAVILYGPRRVGKTTLLHRLETKLTPKPLWLNGDDLALQKALIPSLSAINNVIGNHRTIMIDEAQQIPQIGLIVKLMVDMIPGIRIVASGSSSFALSYQVGEPLVGRAWWYTLYPIAQMEFRQTPHEAKQHLETRLIYGGYPEVVLTEGDHMRQDMLTSIIDGALFNDIFTLDGLKKPRIAVDLARALALQIGSQVSFTELSQLLGVNIATIDRYVYLLEQTFIIARVSGFSRNLRTEIRRTSKYYFWDTGIRNALIRNFNPLSHRLDTGQLWENYIVMERLKRHAYSRWYGSTYFWRTHEGAEIDWVEEKDGTLTGYEIKWSEKRPKVPTQWKTVYPDAGYALIHQDNYLPFVTG